MIPLASHSSHGLTKEIQTALFQKGLYKGQIHGRLDKDTRQAIAEFLKSHKFSTDSGISSALLWFAQQNKELDVVKTVQRALLFFGYKVGAIDGIIGPKTISALKKHQKAMNITPDGKITPDLLFMLIYTAKNLASLGEVNETLHKPVYLKTYKNKQWPNQL